MTAVNQLKYLLAVACVSALGCVTEFDSLESCETVQECFRGEICLIDDGASKGKCTSIEGRDATTSDASILSDSGNDQSLETADMMMQMTTDAMMSDQMMSVDKPMKRWQFAAMTEVQEGDIRRVGDFTLHGGSTVVTDNGLYFPSTASSPNAAILDPSVVSEVYAALMASNAFAFRMWLRPIQQEQSGPARILTWSADTGLRNLTIGHGRAASTESGSSLIGRVRLESFTDRNGITLDDESMSQAPAFIEDAFVNDVGFQQVVFQYDGAGTLELWSDNQKMEVVVPANEGMPISLSSFDATYGFALGNELLAGMPHPSEAPAAVRVWFGHIHTLEIYDRALSEPEIEAFLADKPEVPFQCPQPSPADTPWDVALCVASGETETAGRYCEYSVDSGSNELNMGPNCETFCQRIGMQRCQDLNQTCCWNNLEGGDRCERNLDEPFDCISEEGYTSQICRCFEVTTEMSERVERQPGRSP